MKTVSATIAFTLFLFVSSTHLSSSMLEGSIGHECGIALVRLKKPLLYFRDAYQDTAWGLKKLCMLMEIQRNRGQDGAGIAVVKNNMAPGHQYLEQVRSAKPNSLSNVFQKVTQNLPNIFDQTIMSEEELKQAHPFLGNIYLGHVRYGTFGTRSEIHCQPHVSFSASKHKSFALAGNFNMTNTHELIHDLINKGITPTSFSDTHIVLQQLNDALAHQSPDIDMIAVLRNAAYNWDGGYVFAGILGNGDVFVCRDPAGIRPGYYYENDEVFVIASERAAISNVFNCSFEDIHPIAPATVLVFKSDGTKKQDLFTQPLAQRSCVFERIYFSKSYDPAIYIERKNLGKALASRVLKELENDIANTVFTYIPNSSEISFLGLVEEIQKQTNKQPRIEKLLHKNQKMRTFIADESQRIDLISNLYNVTRGIVKPTDTLVAVDDSIVRGNTLRKSVLTKLAQLNPKRIIIVSSAPPVMYPDCYGIDMSQLGKFIAFQAAVELCKENNQKHLINQINHQYSSTKKDPAPNFLQQLYSPWSLKQLSKKIAKLVRPKNISWSGDISIIYQTINAMHKAIPHHTGDWYFTGNYPTPGGYNILKQSYLQWLEGNNKRAY